MFVVRGLQRDLLGLSAILFIHVPCRLDSISACPRGSLKTSSCSIRCPPGFDSWFAALRYLFNDTVFLDSSLLLVCFCMLTIFFSYTLSTIQLTFLLSTLNLTPFPLGYLPSSFISTLLSQSVCTFLSALNHLLIFFSC